MDALIELQKSISLRSDRPADLSFIGDSPSTYLASLNERFVAQRQVCPERPYGFLLPEAAGTLQFMKDSLTERLAQYGVGEKTVWRKSDVKKYRLYIRWGWSRAAQKMRIQGQAEFDFLTAVRKDLDGLINHAPAYDQLLQLCFFYSRSMALTCDRKEPFRMFALHLALDSGLMKATEELAAFRNGIKAFCPNRNPINKRIISLTDQQIFNPEKPKNFLIPVVGSLDFDAFTRMRHIPVDLFSVMNGPLAADGWIFNEHDTLAHDIYFHPGVQRKGDQRFYQEFDKAEQLQPELQKQQESWYQCFYQAWQKISDPALKSAVADMILTITHDRGEQLYPQTFIQWSEQYGKVFNPMLLSRLYYFATGQLSVAGLSKNFITAMKDTRAAVQWLGEFWSQPEFLQDPIFLRWESHRKRG